MSYGIYIGKNLSGTGHAWLAGYGDEPSSHWLELYPRKTHKEGDEIVVGVTQNSEIPGKLTKIPQVKKTASNMRVNYSYYKGVPPPITNGGLNEYGVAVRDIWSPSRQELIDTTPIEQTGPNYSDLARIILERARSSREGVEIMSEIINEFGESTYGGNSHIIADSKEAWVVIQFAGNIGLWAAERLGDDSIRASRPGYIREIPIDKPGHPDFLYSSNLVSVARKKGWYTGGKFDVNKIYGDSKGPWKGVKWIEKEMLKISRGSEKITLKDVIWAIRTPKLTSDRSGYGQVVPLLDPPNNMLRMIWHSPAGSVSAPFAPVFMGQKETPYEFQQHRYLTSGEDTKFMDNSERIHGFSEQMSNVDQDVEASRSAVYEAKRLLYLMLRDKDKYTTEILETFENHEAELKAHVNIVLRAAELLLRENEKEEARSLLTYFSNKSLLSGLDLMIKLSESIEIRSRLKPRKGKTRSLKMYNQLW
mgnify:CR=1 FL=1